MCGIAGVLYRDPARPVGAGLLKAMGDAIAHRGPDGEGFWSAPGIGLSHRRLSIIDLAGGAQPLGNEDGSVQITFNGEIYNYRPLREWLLGRGHVFRTNSDTEVLVHLYEEAGDDLVGRLRGMFAFALWDARRQRLLLARDRLGIKPLYVYRDGAKVLFASEVKALLADADVPRELDALALEDYLAFGMVPGPRSIFRHVEKLQPAHVLAIDRASWSGSPRRYWQLRLEPDPRPTGEEWQEAVRDKLTETARAHLIADVPVGAFLSGGVDSGAVVAACAGATRGPMQTFSIGFPEKEFSELSYARQVAERFGSRHTEEVVTPDAVGLLDRLAHFFDEPFADPSALPTFLVARLASRGVKVVLSGDGGDEAFGGYARYAHDLKEEALRRRLPGWLRPVFGLLARAWPKADWLPRPLRLKTLMTNLSLDAGSAYANTLTVCRPPLRRRLLSPGLRERLNGHDPWEAVRAGHALARAGRPLDGMLCADVAVVLPDDFLVKVDRASMAHGLEVRPPLLDHELLELAARIPAGLKVHKGETKWVFKRAVEGWLPRAVVWRPKQGFEVPVDAWLRGPLRPMVEDVVLAPGGPLAPLVERPAVERLYRRHLSGVGRHGPVLWSLLVLARWAGRYLDSRAGNGIDVVA